jgi:hypothetical protein
LLQSIILVAVMPDIEAIQAFLEMRLVNLNKVSSQIVKTLLRYNKKQK